MTDEDTSIRVSKETLADLTVLKSAIAESMSMDEFLTVLIKIYRERQQTLERRTRGAGNS